MADVKWIKVSTEMFNSSRKIKQIEMMPEGDTILVIWLKLLLLAGNINDGGQIYLTPEIPYTDEMLANELRRPLTTVRMALNLFEKFGMISIVDDILHLAAWEKYQSVDKLAEIREQNRLRKQKQRQALTASSDMSRDSHVTGHGTGHTCHAIEEDREKDKDLDIHSFIQSAENVFETPVENPAPVENSVEKQRAKREYLQGSLGKGVVMLSGAELDSLLEELSIAEFDKYVEIVANNELRGHKYKRVTHYQAILDMATKDRKKSSPVPRYKPAVTEVYTEPKGVDELEELRRFRDSMRG